MKSIVLFIIAMFISANSISQNGINYKALIKDANGDALVSQGIFVQFQILESGTLNVYQETHDTTTDANGIVVINIGEGTVNSGNFLTVDWGSGDHFLNVQVDTGDGFVDLGTTQFKSVPYAMIAKDTEKGTLNDAYNKGGPGAGKTIDALDGKVTVTGDGFEVKDETNNPILFVDGPSNKIGIGTNDPKGALDISSNNNLGAIMPRVADVSLVTDGNGNPPVDGTMVFDTSKNKLCVYINGEWACFGFNENGQVGGENPNAVSYDDAEITLLQDNPSNAGQYLGADVSINAAGTVMALSKPRISSNSPASIIIFEKINNEWQESQEIVPSLSTNFYGMDTDIDAEGNTLVVGAYSKVFVYENSNGTWQETQVLDSPSGYNDYFGLAVSMADDGLSFATSAIRNTSDAIGINGDFTASGGSFTGGVYLFEYDGLDWNLDTYFGPGSNPQNVIHFGWNLALSGDGNTLAATSISERGAGTGVDADPSIGGASNSGALFVYKKNGGNWAFNKYIKAHNAETEDRFGSSVAISQNGNTIAVGAPQEDSFEGKAFNQNENYPTDNYKGNTGAVYIFDYDNGAWQQTAFIKNSNNDISDNFGLSSVAFNATGTILAVAAPYEDSFKEGVFDESSDDNIYSNSGAVYLYEKRQGNWTFINYVKPKKEATNLYFGATIYRDYYNGSVWINDGSCIAINALGDTVIAGYPRYDANSGGVVIIEK
ncbi:MAG: hypothetical protein ACSHW7_01445 [Patiriisocius sp.]|uniref:hypothetical protein n=1 Tax=Patiriisocius sp. TaxID=2822396 RepID=UPI003EF37BED